MLCTAYTKSGEPCRANAMRDEHSGRCRVHRDAPPADSPPTSPDASAPEDIVMSDEPAQALSPEVMDLNSQSLPPSSEASTPPQTPLLAPTSPQPTTPPSPTDSTPNPSPIASTPPTTTSIPTPTDAPADAESTAATTTTKTTPAEPKKQTLAQQVAAAAAKKPKGQGSKAFDEGRKTAEEQLEAVRKYAELLDAAWELLPAHCRRVEAVTLIRDTLNAQIRTAAGSQHVPRTAETTQAQITGPRSSPSLPPRPNAAPKAAGRSPPDTGSYASVVRQATPEQSSPPRTSKATRKTPANTAPANTAPAKKDSRVFVTLTPESPFRKLDGPSLMAHLLREYPGAREMVLSVNPVASGIAVQLLARETEKLLAKADNIGAAFMAGPGRTRNAWTKLVVHSVPSRTSELLNNSVCEREFSEE